MKFAKIAGGLFLLLYFGTTLSAQEKWVLQKEKDGIRISSRPTAHSRFNDIRVEMDLPGNINQLKAILLDVNGYRVWGYATKKSVLVKQLGPGKLIYYSEIEAPWPATNRYFYASFEMQEDSIGHSFKVVSVSLKDYGPVQKELLRIPYSKGVWNVTTISRKTIHVDYVLELDPGGSVPVWIINLFASKGPLTTFENIRRKMVSLN